MSKNVSNDSSTLGRALTLLMKKLLWCEVHVKGLFNMNSFIDRKVRVFVSSKCGGLYTVARKSIGFMLEESGLCQAFVFEEDYGTSMPVVSSYLSELSDSDLVVFLIENKDGVTDPVQSELNLARELKKKCIFIFCDENEKNATPLQVELKSKLQERYTVEHEFSNIAITAYRNVINDIVRIYRQNESQIISLNTSEQQRVVNIDDSNIVDIQKDYVKGLKYTKTILPKELHLNFEEVETKSDIDTELGELLAVILGNFSSSNVNFEIIEKYIQSMYLDIYKDIVSIRIEALKFYLQGDARNANKSISKAKAEVLKIPKAPQWLINDIAIDLRNTKISADIEQGVLSLGEEGQAILDGDTNCLYNPIVDRFNYKLYEDIYSFESKRRIESPFSTQLGGFELYINDITEAFVAGVFSCSITHIIQTRKRLADFLILCSLRYRNHDLYIATVKFLILENDDKRLKQYLSSYGETTNHFSSRDVDKLQRCVANEGMRTRKIKMQALLLEHFGYYYADDLFESTWSAFRDDITECVIDGTLLYNLAGSILKAIEGIQYRIRANSLIDICWLFFEYNRTRWYDEVFKLLSRVNIINKLDYQKKKELVDWCKKCLNDKSIRDNTNFLCEMTQVIRLQLDKEAASLDQLVEKYYKNYYDRIYSLNVLEHTQSEDWEYISVLLDNISEQNKHQGKNGVYHGYATNDYKTISNIILNKHVPIKDKHLDKLVQVSGETIYEKTQTFEAKYSAFKLLIIVQMCEPKNRKIRKLLETITSIEDITSSEHLLMNPQYSEETLFIIWQLANKMILNQDRTEDIIVPLCHAGDASVICVLDTIACLLSTENDNKLLMELIYALWPSFALFEQSTNDEIQFMLAVIYSYLGKSRLKKMALNRLVIMMDTCSYKAKVGAISRLKNNCVDGEIVEYIYQKGRVDNHFLVRQVTNREKNLNG